MSQLTKYEMACLTAQVPMSGDPRIDAIISTSLRLKLATQFLEAIISHAGIGTDAEDMTFDTACAIVQADTLMQQFESNGVETSATDA